MTHKEERVINYIIKNCGDCCAADTCKNCPFLSDCAKYMMRDYKYPSTNAKVARVTRALKILTNAILVGDTDEPIDSSNTQTK